jgi:hypothetical protein
MYSLSDCRNRTAVAAAIASCSDRRCCNQAAASHLFSRFPFVFRASREIFTMRVSHEDDDDAVARK